jgi:TolB-like protein/class 3 adenylate cyclase/Tfp pilus assembly protein PilF
VASESEENLRLEIGHVLFIDLVGYSKLLIEEQKARLRQLTEIVLATTQVAEANNERLVRLPTGDGMALVFRNSAEEPANCALEISQSLKTHPEIAVRMGIHSGPVSEVTDVSGRTNITGGGINMAQRVMDCGDAGHILLSKHVADDLHEHRKWSPWLHDFGECEVKHGVRLGIVNLCRDGAGNPQLPKKVRAFRHRQTRKRWGAIAAALTFLVIAGAVFLFFSHPKSIIAAPIRSVAVLPLVNTSGDPNNEYFSDGLSDELIAVLAKIPGLKVIGRNSSFLFKGKSGDTASIGQKLGVAQLIQGSVLRQGDRVRIIAEMIRASSGETLWSETYDREAKDVFAVQSDIAQAVAAQLKIKLLGEKPGSDSARSNPNPAAHDALLQGAFYASQGNADGVRKAIGYATEATQLDPNYAEAWATLAAFWRAYGVSDATDDIDQAYASARAAAARAVALDPKSIDALSVMSALAVAPDLDFASSEKYARRGHELAPGSVDGLGDLASALIAQGKLKEALQLRLEITAADPMQGSTYQTGLVLVGLHRYAEARAMFTKYLEMRPKAARVHTQFATLDVLENNPKGALEHAHLEQQGIWRDFATAMALEAGEAKPAADAALQAFIDEYAKTASFQVAILYAQRHEPDQMFKWLETAYANRDAGLSRLFVIPFLTDYRDDPRFAGFCRKLGIESLPPKP